MGELSRTGRWLRRWWPVVGAGAAALFVAGVIGLLWFLDVSAHGEARLAQREFAGDEIEALIQLVDSERHPLRDRNRAVWALGQLRDRRGLPTLLEHYTGAPCQHDRFLCQRELKKAIDLCSGKPSAPAWFARIRQKLTGSAAGS